MELRINYHVMVLPISDPSNVHLTYGTVNK